MMEHTAPTAAIDHRTRRQRQSAITCVLAVVALFIIAGSLLASVPSFADTISDFGLEVPIVTIAILNHYQGIALVCLLLAGAMAIKEWLMPRGIATLVINAMAFTFALLFFALVTLALALPLLVAFQSLN